MKYYAVSVGRNVGIYNTWDECSKNIIGISGAKFKSFERKEDAEKFISTYRNTSENLEEIPIKEIEKKVQKFGVKRSIEQVYGEQLTKKDIKEKDKKDDIIITLQKKKKYEILRPVKVFTDGACSKNGRENACAGIGVYFQEKERNLPGMFKHKNEVDMYEDISEKINGKQTNNRAELSAILKALTVVDLREPLIIHTDSEYSINGIMGINKRLKNQDLFNSIDEKIKCRKAETTFKKVKGHTGLRDGNYYADYLATKAIR
jgi:ribonuclease HI